MTKLPSAPKEEFWRQVLVEHAASGLGAKEFCSRKDLSLHSFYAWKRVIKKRDNRGDGLHALVPVKIVDGTTEPTSFSAHSFPLKPTMRICLPGKIVVEFFTENAP